MRRTMILSLVLASCGARTEPTAPDDAAMAVDADLSPLEMSASFSVSHDPARGGATANGLLWTGPRRPSPGGTGGPGYRLQPGESVSVNGVAFQGGFADWGYTYQAGSVPVPADGRWVFRFVLRGRTLVREVVLRPVAWVDFPAAPVSVAQGVTLRWAPPLPDDTTRRGVLTSCVRNERVEVGTASMTVRGSLTADPCVSHAQLTATRAVQLGAPFREGSTVSASTSLDRELRVVP